MMDKTLGENYFKIRNMLIFNKIKELELFPDKKSYVSDVNYFNDFARLNLCFGRGTGSTYWLNHTVKELKKNGFGYVVAFPTLMTLEGSCFEKDDYCVVANYNVKLLGKDLSNVSLLIFEMSSCLEEKEKNEMLNFCIYNCENLVLAVYL